MSPREWALIIILVAAWLFLIVWFRRYAKNTVAKTGKAKEINEATTRIRAYGSTILGGAFVAYLLYNSESIPEQNLPILLSFIIPITLWVGYSWYKFLRMKR